MPILFTCPSCNLQLRAPDGTEGRAVTCPRCKTSIPIPFPAPPSVDPADDKPVQAFPVPDREITGDTLIPTDPPPVTQAPLDKTPKKLDIASIVGVCLVVVSLSILVYYWLTSGPYSVRSVCQNFEQLKDRFIEVRGVVRKRMPSSLPDQFEAIYLSDISGDIFYYVTFDNYLPLKNAMMIGDVVTVSGKVKHRFESSYIVDGVVVVLDKPVVKK